MQQLPEIIYIDEVLHTLYTTPLTPWLRERDPPLVFDQRAANCDRGYVGKWNIEDDSLFLIGLYGWRDGEHTRVSDLFGEGNEVLADWFTGPLVVEPASSEVAVGAMPGIKTLFVKAGRVMPA